MQRIKRFLAALVILIPMFAAAGFLRMATESCSYRTTTSDSARCFFASPNFTRELERLSGEDLSWCYFLGFPIWSFTLPLDSSFPDRSACQTTNTKTS